MSDTAMPELDLPPHPESHVMQWSELEKTAIRSAIKAERLRLSVPRAESRPEMPAADIWETLTPENRAFSRTQMRLHHEAWQEYAASIEAERDAIKLEAQMWKQEAMTHKATVLAADRALTAVGGEHAR